MKAYTKGITKEQFVAETIKHQKMDSFIRGEYGELGDKVFKGCAVGCALESVSRLKGIKLLVNNHKEYENHLGIPEWIARLEDRIFEGVSEERAKIWPLEFAQAVNEGADLNKIKIPFLIFIVESVRTHAKNEKSLKAIDNVLFELKKDVLDLKSLREARAAAAYAAVYAAYAAADDAADDAAVYAAVYAAYAAAEVAADDAAVAVYAAAAARKNAFSVFADKLLELMRGCN